MPAVESSELRLFFITFRTYGTWLHGDPRGSVDRDHNAPGTERIPSRVGLEAWETQRLTSAPVILSNKQRVFCEEAIHSLAARKMWRLIAANVRTNHVHVVVGATEPGERVMSSIKSTMTANLRRAKAIGIDTRVWSRHGSVQSLSKAEAVARTANYTANRQGAGGFLAEDW